VRYEDLSSDPERELRRICTFIGVAYTPEMLAFSDKSHHILNGNRMRFDSSGITPDLSWREKLSPRDISYFDTRAGRLNRELGYA
jgi:hypothetical protein